MGGSWHRDPVVGRNADARLEVFVVGDDTSLYHAWQTSPNNGWVQGWTGMGGSWHHDPVVGRNADGRLEVFVVGDNARLYHAWQTSPNDGWSQGWAPMGGWWTSWPASPGVTQNADGRIEVFLRGNDTSLYHTWQVAPNDGWALV